MNKTGDHLLSRSLNHATKPDGIEALDQKTRLKKKGFGQTVKHGSARAFSNDPAMQIYVNA